jgi:acyl-[acyl-carrier-protein]-phospholipid O-acyltransferase/long-chain-fatty-acid--[acyl-carrier-protein] ligase
VGSGFADTVRRGWLRTAHRLDAAGEDALSRPGQVIVAAIASPLDLKTLRAFAPDGARLLVPPDLGGPDAVAVDRPCLPVLRMALADLRAGRSVVVVAEPPDRRPLAGAWRGAALLARLANVPVTAVVLRGLDRALTGPAGDVTRRPFPRAVLRADTPSPVCRGRSHAERNRAASDLRRRIAALAFAAADLRPPLFGALQQAAARYGRGRIAVEDSVGGSLTFGRLLMGAGVLGRMIAKSTIPGEIVGVMLPNAAGAAATFWALQATGRVPAMLNYTAGRANLTAACRVAEVRTVLSSRAFVEKAKLEEVAAALGEVARVVWLEDLRAGIGPLDKVLGALTGFLPARGPRGDAPAVVLFTSGSEGTPKGVVLSHRNMLANCAQVAARVAFGPRDTLFNVLPVFHSFGLTAGMVLPTLHGVRLHLFPSPLLYKQVPDAIRRARATILFATDTFLMGYARQADREDFAMLRLLLSGAEPVKAETRRVYAEKFGLDLLEGYGLTEATPVVAVNTSLDNRDGTVGQVLPGIEVRLEPVPGIEADGRLWLKGPNVMRGYLKVEAPGVLEPPPDGWHDVGDVVTIDEDGFVAIRGRVKRFAKIAGEMISLGAVEALVADLYPQAGHAVVAVPDARRGERVVLVTDAAADKAAILAHARARGATELMVPADILQVDAVPLLGSGKTDYVAARCLALERLAS